MLAPHRHHSLSHHSPLTIHYSPSYAESYKFSSITLLLLLQCCYPAHRRASPNTLSILFFTLTREHSHLVVVSAPHIQLGHRNQPLSTLLLLLLLLMNQS